MIFQKLVRKEKKIRRQKLVVRPEKKKKENSQYRKLVRQTKEIYSPRRKLGVFFLAADVKNNFKYKENKSKWKEMQK